MLTQAPKGTRDILPSQSYKWQHIESVIRDVCRIFGYRETRTPTFEHTELFMRGVGGTTDIVQKEMYTFDDKGGRSVTLKPEGTAGVARSFIENGLFNEPLPLKMYYLAMPIFRYENPQSGRQREHHQFGVEVFGAGEPSIDAEVIRLAMRVFEKLGVPGLKLYINSIGCPACRPAYHEKLKAYFKPQIGAMCGACRERYGKNPLRLLDCKVEECKKAASEAPAMVDWLCGECSAHFEKLKEYLGALNVSYKIDPFIVRGLDYYTKTVFEIVSEDIGAQGTVCGGGRYDRLIEELGGPPTPAVGFGMGMERLLLVVENAEVIIPWSPAFDVFIASAGEKARTASFGLAEKLRNAGISAECDHMGRSLKAQFKYADKSGCGYTVILGDEELESGLATVRNMTDSKEEKADMGTLAAYFEHKLKKR
ncbi:MAG: histidine--tRNA ligase [Bacillota bacterium]|nr:histidine--tRNA ligase [Bacillota bacterium]